MDVGLFCTNLTSMSVSSRHCGCKIPIMSNIRENLNLFSARSIDSGDVPKILALKRKFKLLKLLVFSAVIPVLDGYIIFVISPIWRD